MRDVVQKGKEGREGEVGNGKDKRKQEGRKQKGKEGKWKGKGRDGKRGEEKTNQM